MSAKQEMDFCVIIIEFLSIIRVNQNIKIIVIIFLEISYQEEGGYFSF